MFSALEAHTYNTRRVRMKLNFKLAFNPSDEENNNSTGHEFNPQKDGVFLCGSLDVLGAWNLKKAVEMTPVTFNKSPANKDAAHKLSQANLDITPDSYSPYSSISSASSIDFNPDNNL